MGKDQRQKVGGKEAMDKNQRTMRYSWLGKRVGPRQQSGSADNFSICLMGLLVLPGVINLQLFVSAAYLGHPFDQ
jgi:hypothetical protein